MTAGIRQRTPRRRWFGRAWVLVCLAVCTAFPCFAWQRREHAPPPPRFYAPYSRPMPMQRWPGNRPGNRRPGQEHLPQWLANHQDLSLQQQENALRREPGFNRLPQSQQLRLMGRLRSLDSKPPAQRARILARMENMERLSPEQRQEVRGAAQALSQMDPARKRMVKRAFHDLRDLPPEQRQQVLHSPRFAAEFSPQERTVLGNLLSVEPYQPPAYIGPLPGNYDR